MNYDEFITNRITDGTLSLKDRLDYDMLLDVFKNGDKSEDVLLYLTYSISNSECTEYLQISSLFFKDISSINMYIPIQKHAVSYGTNPHNNTTSIEYNVLENEEAPLYIMNFNGRLKPEGKTYIEMSQIFTHFLDIYYVPHLKAYCKYDENGELIKIISIIEKDAYSYVLIKRKYLDFYLWITKKHLVKHISSTTITPHFSSWGVCEKEKHIDEQYSKCCQEDGAFVNGYKCFPITTPNYQLENYLNSSQFEERKYETFKLWDWKNKCSAQLSISPENFTNYFETTNNLPFELSPIFFKPEVLSKYKNNPDLYTISEHSISSNSWSLRSYGVNDNLIYVYVIDLQKLPYNEQSYWKSFNINPPEEGILGGISKSSFERDFLGHFCNEMSVAVKINELLPQLMPYSSLISLSKDYKVNDLYEDNSLEWAKEIANLQNIFINSLIETKIKKILSTIGIDFSTNDKSIKLLKLIFSHYDLDVSHFDLLRDINYIRNHTYGHYSQEEKDKLVSKSRTEYEDLRVHYNMILRNILEYLNDFIKLCNILQSNKLI